MILKLDKNFNLFYVCICFIISCTNINDVYNKRFNFYSFYEDLTIIENSGLLRTEDTELLKLFIDHKILKDSIPWLKTQSYKQLFNCATEQASKGSANSVLDLSWKTNNSVHIVLDSFNTDNGDMRLKFQNMTPKSIKYIRALLKFKSNTSKLGQYDLIFNDTIKSGEIILKVYNDRVIFNFQYINDEILTIPIIRRVVFVDSTEYINPLSSYFE